MCLGAGPGPTGGGFAQPQYQLGLSVASAPAGVRYVPDVSLLASPNFPGYVFCTPLSELNQGGSTSSCASSIFQAVDVYGSIVGGTSVSSPVFAGIVALLNQDVVLSGFQSAPGLGNINPTLYHLAASNPTAFHQVTTGDNTVYCQAGTPAGYPPNVVCPTAGSFGYAASNKDSVTGYNLVAGLGSVDASNLLTAWIAASLGTTTTSLTSSPNPARFGVSVTFTATVTTTGSTPPTGTVTFNDGTTALGTGTLNGSLVATFATSTLTAGTHSITAVYGGDANNTGSTSAVLSQVIKAPTFTITTPTTPATALSGQSATSTFSVTPTSGTTTVPITFACNGLPDATVGCTFSPTQIAAGAVGGTAIPVTLTITTSGPNSGTVKPQHRRADNRSPWLPLTLPLAGIVMVGFARRKMSKHSAIAGLCVSLVLIGFLVACGSSGPPVAISVSPAGATVFASGPPADNWPPQTATFTATVTHTSNTAVNWSVSPTTNGGSITSGGVYTAPTAAVGLPGSATITATSQADTTKTATATVTITPTTVPGSYQLSVTATEGPTSNTTGQFTLTVQ